MKANAYVNLENLALNGIKLNPGCRNCVFSSSGGWCIYYLITGTRRNAKADRNGCAKKMTKSQLKQHPEQLLSKKVIRDYNRGPKPMIIDEKKAKTLYDKGAHDAQIAAALNCSKTTVVKWRQKNDLPSHFRKRKDNRHE